MSYNDLRDNIRENITSNNNHEITGEVLQEVLLNMVEQVEDGDKQIEDCLEQCESQFAQLSGDLEQTKTDLQGTKDKLEETRLEIAQKNFEFESSLGEISGEVENNKRLIGEVQQTSENNSADIESLGREVNNRYTKQEIEDKEVKLREDIDGDFARKDGSYPNMTVGKADALNTPSGSILHSQFVRLGAVWNDSTKFWELNGLTDLTTSQMEKIWDAHITMGYCQTVARTNFPNNYWRTGGYNNQAMLPSKGLFASSEIEVFIGPASFANLQTTFSNCNKLRKVDKLTMSYVSGQSVVGVFNGCTSLTELYMSNICRDIDLSYCPLTIDSIVYIITKSRTANNSVITLRSDIYQQAIADERVQEALATYTNITLAEAE